MNDTTKPAIPAISATDPDGVRWEFDPAKSRWSATVSGKKMSSADFSKLHDKVLLALAAQATPTTDTQGPSAPPATRQVEVAMIAVSIPRSITGSQPTSPFDMKIEFEPIVVKMEWNTEKGGMEVVRYKTATSGWKQRNTEHQILFHPSFVPDELRSLVEATTRANLVLDIYHQTRSAIARSWWATKPDLTQAWEIVHQKGLCQSSHLASSSNPRHLAYINPQWLLADHETCMDVSGWEQTPAGDLRRGSVLVKMSDLSSSLSPSFKVYMQGVEHPVFSDRDLSRALWIGNATHLATTSPARAHEEWVGTAKWNEGKPGSMAWPVCRRVHAAALFQANSKDHFAHHGYPESHVLCEDASRPMASAPRRYSDEPAGLAWRPANPHYQPPRFRAAGPEDDALQPLANLRQGLDDMDTDQVHLDAMLAFTPQALSHVSGLIEDGEELTTDIQVMANQVNILVDRARARAAKSKQVQAWSARCEDTLEQCEKLLAATPPPAPDRKPRP